MTDLAESAAGAPPAPAPPAPVPLLEALPPAVAEGGLLPFAFGVTGPAPRDDVSTLRTAGSEAYRAAVFVCWPAPRPITRCLAILP